jgi:sarcosine oxidase subunit alpha
MLGFDSNYVPGWDCHGLPIEWKIEEENYRSKGKAKPDFIGKRSLARPEMLRPDRRQLVGLVPRDGAALPDEGAQLIGSAGSRMAEGHVTSAYRSACLGHPIALGLLAGGRARLGETVFATSLDGAPMALEVVSPAFLDPKGDRLRG